MKVLALDMGDAWVGTAITDGLRMFARPYQTIPAQDLEKNLKKIFSEENISIVVVGLPKTLKGTDSQQTTSTIAQKENLEKLFPEKKWVLWDERMTSKQAAHIKPAKNKNDKLQQHSVAAALILDSYLLFLNSQNN